MKAMRTRVRNWFCGVLGHRDFRYYSDGVRYCVECRCGASRRVENL